MAVPNPFHGEDRLKHRSKMPAFIHLWSDSEMSGRSPTSTAESRLENRAGTAPNRKASKKTMLLITSHAAKF